jgi:hypothetical protein
MYDEGTRVPLMVQYSPWSATAHAENGGADRHGYATISRARPASVPKDKTRSEELVQLRTATPARNAKKQTPIHARYFSRTSPLVGRARPGVEAARPQHPDRDAGCREPGRPSWTWRSNATYYELYHFRRRPRVRTRSVRSTSRASPPVCNLSLPIGRLGRQSPTRPELDDATFEAPAALATKSKRDLPVSLHTPRHQDTKFVKGFGSHAPVHTRDRAVARGAQLEVGRTDHAARCGCPPRCPGDRSGSSSASARGERRAVSAHGEQVRPGMLDARPEHLRRRAACHRSSGLAEIAPRPRSRP